MNKRIMIIVSAVSVIISAGGCRKQSSSETNTIVTSPVEQERRSLSDWLRIHDPSSIVKFKDKYILFSTGRGIRTRYSKDLINWEGGSNVFSEYPGWISEVVPNLRDFWAPDVIYIDSRYMLYYSVSVWGKRTSAIGLATNTTLDESDPEYLWIDQGEVIRTDETKDYNAIDPALTIDEEGRLWLVFGSYWSGIKLIELDLETGKRISPDSPMYSLAYHSSIEAAFIYHHGDHYYLFVNWGQCCQKTESTYNIRIGRSKKITGPYLDKDNVDMMDDGGSLFLGSEGRFIGPGHAGIYQEDSEEWFCYHYYDGENRGAATIGIRLLEWDDDGWPVAGPYKDSGLIGNDE